LQGDQNLGSTSANCPLGPTYGSSYSDGPGQMVHFAQDDLFNAFRIPVSWQFITNSETATNKPNPTNFAQYDL
jgi:endoglucanase